MFKQILKNRNILSILLAIWIFIIILIINHFDFLYTFDKKVQRLIIVNKIDVSNDIVVIEIDDKTLEDWTLWRFPFNRKYYWPIVDYLKREWAAVTAFDMIFTEKSNPDSDKIFSDSIKNAKNVIIWSYIANSKDQSKNNKLKSYFKKSIFNDYLLSTWFVSPIINKKNWVVYSIFPFAKLGEWNIYDHLSIAILKEYYKYIYNNTIEVYDNKYDKNYFYLTENKKIPFSREWSHEILINYIDRTENSYLKFRTFSFIDIYKDALLKEKSLAFDFKDKIVIIWTSAKGIKDIFYTPNGSEPWVYTHTNMINTVLKNNYIVYFNKNIEYLLLLLLIILSVYFNLSRSGYILFLSNITIAIVFLIIFPILVVFFSKTIINFPIELLVWLILSLAVSNTVKYLIENKNKVKLNKALSEYVSVDVAKEILSWEWKINLDWENKKIAIFFSDIEWFTSISEQFSPEELVWFLREYLSDMSDVIMDEKWFINKYEWDAIMALWWVFWEDNNKSYSICLSAIKQQNLLKELNKEWSKRGFSEIKARIGMHLWNAIIWNIWSEWRKMEFTALWDSVNLASRLEWVNKFYGTYICASEDIYLIEKDNFEFRYLDKIKVKWKEIPIKIYELLWIKWEVSAEQLEIKKLFEKATELYLAREFIKARTIFRKLIKMWDSAWKMYLDMCDIYIKSPPWDDWSGIATMSWK